MQKKVSFESTHPYETMNAYTADTKTVWVVFHGMGYLSKYFLRYFAGLDSKEHYIIAPQGLNTYYQDNRFKHVGASWLTRENTHMGIDNILSYMEAIWKEEAIDSNVHLVVLGYSQGVSIATRWLAFAKHSCDQLVLLSGSVPKELTATHFEHLSEAAIVSYHYGTNDEYISESRAITEIDHIQSVFGSRLKVSTFEGPHEVDTDFIKAQKPLKTS
ncbi:alpha/beta hydrolase [Altibacter sp. HG106]|uniref:alpha/beta hydrolase n=1 Tax=Altibacter sp. HG106 TaxID=3023937 RepID=UPI002350FBCC|nr:esterase [Altibacter sp. HG106]MDC7995405.1 esterase [Altibacter sp. HG106]